MYTWMALSSAADLSKLNGAIGREYSPEYVSKKLASGISDAVKGVLIERNYIDKDFRSTFYNFYSKMGRHYALDCVRLHFFDGTVSFDEKRLKLSCSDGDERLTNHYYGYMVLRPTGVATIGRSVVSPDVRSGASGFTIHADHKVHLLGYRLTVQGFPSMDQHSDISVCAHAACWSILRHYSVRYNSYREFLTHDITMMAQQFNPGGLVPSKGLNVSHAERVFQEAGTFPVWEGKRKSPDDISFYRHLSAYVESGFPLFAAMHSKRHAVAVIGYEWRTPQLTGQPGLRYSWDEVSSLAVIDDNHLPYLSIPKSGGSHYSIGDIDAFIVPLPEKIYYPAEAVDNLGPALFGLAGVLGLPPKDELILRYFITTGSAYRKFVRERASAYDDQLLRTIMTLPFAQFIWVIELATEAQWAAGQVAGRAIIDATASLRDNVPFWLFYSKSHALVFDRDSVGVELGKSMGAFALKSVHITSYPRMEQNLRPTVTK